jgi:mannose-6-phosphate isomerase
VAGGPLAGQTIATLLAKDPYAMLGSLAADVHTFPVLLKFLDALEMLSIQVHPTDSRTDLIPAGETGKTEAWVVLRADPGSRIYAGLKPDVGLADVRDALRTGGLADLLVSFVPEPGDAFFVPAGTVHTLGGGIVAFEVQQNSDVTFRLDDWARVDAKSGRPRTLQVEQALAAIELGSNGAGLVAPVVEEEKPARRERLFDCRAFRVWRLVGNHARFRVGADGAARVLVGLAGEGQVDYGTGICDVRRGSVVLLPALLGACTFLPRGAVTMLEIALPDSPASEDGGR